jgi:anti-anti-sigma factor
MMSAGRTDSLRISLSIGGVSKDIHVVRVDGKIDTITNGELDDVMGALIGRACCRLVVDLAGVHYISSAGWGIFVSRLREARDGGGDIKLARMQAPVREIYDLLEFEGLLPHHERLEDAQAGFDGGSPHLSWPDLQIREAAALPGSGNSSGAAAEHPAPTLETSEPVGIPAPTTLDDAVVQLVLEDPFYSLGELRSRLAEVGDFRTGRWAIWQVLRRRKLIRQKQRFRFYRRRRTATPAAWR